MGSKTTLVVTATSKSLMSAAEKGPAETEETRERRFFKQVKKELAYFGNAERDHHGQTNPCCQMLALRLCEGESGWEGFHRFSSFALFSPNCITLTTVVLERDSIAYVIFL